MMDHGGFHSEAQSSIIQIYSKHQLKCKQTSKVGKVEGTPYGQGFLAQTTIHFCSAEHFAQFVGHILVAIPPPPPDQPQLLL